MKGLIESIEELARLRHPDTLRHDVNVHSSAGTTKPWEAQVRLGEGRWSPITGHGEDAVSALRALHAAFVEAHLSTDDRRSDALVRAYPFVEDVAVSNPDRVVARVFDHIGKELAAMTAPTEPPK